MNYEFHFFGNFNTTYSLVMKVFFLKFGVVARSYFDWPITKKFSGKLNKSKFLVFSGGFSLLSFWEGRVSDSGCFFFLFWGGNLRRLVGVVQIERWDFAKLGLICATPFC